MCSDAGCETPMKKFLLLMFTVSTRVERPRERRLHLCLHISMVAGSGLVYVLYVY